MAEKVGSVYIEIQAKMGSLEKDLKSLEAKLNGVGQNGQQTGSSLATMGKLIAGAGITGAVIGLGKAALSAAAQMEQNRVAFTTMLGSADKANKLLQEMTDFAASTPFELPEIVTAGKQMLAFGFGANEVIDNLRMLGDVSAGLSVPVGDMVYLFGQIKTQGRAMTQDLMQFANRGVPIFDELSKSMGIGKEEVKKYAEQGKIGFGEIEQVFKNLTAEGSKFGGMTEAQSKTLAGQWSNFNDALGKSLTLLGDDMSPTMKAILSTANSILAWSNDMTAEQQRLKEIEVERLKTVGDTGTAYLVQNGLIATALNLMNGNFEKEQKISDVKKQQEKIETVLAAHRNGTITLTKEALTQLEKNTAELERQDKILKGTNDGWAKQTGAYKTLNDFLAKANKGQQDYRDNADANAKAAEAEFKKAYDARLSYFDKLLKDQEAMEAEYGSVSMALFVQDLSAKAQAYQQYAGVLTNMSGQLAQLSQMNASNQTAEVDNRLTKEMDAIEARYQREKELIEQSVMTQEEKDAALKALDEKRAREEKAAADKAAKEKRKIAHEAAKQQKMLAMFDVLITTPQAALNAFTGLAKYNIIAAGIAAAGATALGLAKLKLIADQPLPALAEGGIVPAVPGGNQFTIGEAGSAEAVIPLNDSTLSRLAGMINSSGGGSGQNMNINLNIDGETLGSWIYTASKNGYVIVDSRAVV